MALKMTRDPWTDPDPQPGDFDADLAAINPRDVESHVGVPSAKLTIVAGSAHPRESSEPMCVDQVIAAFRDAPSDDEPWTDEDETAAAEGRADLVS